jgi:hypothetical protein
VSYLLANNKRWVHNKTQEDPDFFKRQALGHHPEYLFIGCSDARLSVQNMLGLEVHIEHIVKRTELPCFVSCIIVMPVMLRFKQWCSVSMLALSMAMRRSMCVTLVEAAHH